MQEERTFWVTEGQWVEAARSEAIAKVTEYQYLWPVSGERPVVQFATEEGPLETPQIELDPVLVACAILRRANVKQWDAKSVEWVPERKMYRVTAWRGVGRGEDAGSPDAV